jgi:hypothetical protein
MVWMGGWVDDVPCDRLRSAMVAPAAIARDRDAAATVYPPIVDDGCTAG